MEGNRKQILLALHKQFDSDLGSSKQNAGAQHDKQQ
jgi:hypothetical protein